VIDFFGGTYESAKSDERKEFNKMLQFVKRSKEKISHIIVYNEDRFSRTGANAIYIAAQLKKEGILVHTALNHVDTTTSGGTLQQNIKFIFAQHDNDQRRERTINGMREKMLRGHWACHAPTGYDHLTINGEKKIVPNAKAKLIKKAFYWKGEEGLSNIEIQKRLVASGLAIDLRRLTDIFRNPFYCGIITHSLLEGEIIEGKHEPLISKELFLKANNIQRLRQDKYKHKKEDENVPLRRFIKCGECGRPFVGYAVKPKGLYYYKCNTPGCRCNRKVDHMHQLFLSELGRFTITNEEILDVYAKQLQETFYELTESNRENEKQYKTQISEIDKKLEKLEERFAFGDIDRDLYHKFTGRLQEEKSEIRQEMEKSDFDLSNLPKYVEFSLSIASNLQEMWQMADYSEKEKLQNLVFPEGIVYDRKKDGYRTPRVNSVFELISCLSDNLKLTESGVVSENADNSALVTLSGVERVCVGCAATKPLKGKKSTAHPL
jgi:DNA invertase Pin-like site-specific DNA recombinase